MLSKVTCKTCFNLFTWDLLPPPDLLELIHLGPASPPTHLLGPVSTCSLEISCPRPLWTYSLRTRLPRPHIYWQAGGWPSTDRPSCSNMVYSVLAAQNRAMWKRENSGFLNWSLQSSVWLLMQLYYVAKGILINSYWRKCINRWLLEYSAVLFRNTFQFVCLMREGTFVEVTVKCAEAILEEWNMECYGIMCMLGGKEEVASLEFRISSHICLCNNCYKL